MSIALTFRKMKKSTAAVAVAPRAAFAGHSHPRKEIENGQPLPYAPSTLERTLSQFEEIRTVNLGSQDLIRV